MGCHYDYFDCNYYLCHMGCHYDDIMIIFSVSLAFETVSDFDVYVEFPASLSKKTSLGLPVYFGAW